MFVLKMQLNLFFFNMKKNIFIYLFIYHSVSMFRFSQKLYALVSDCVGLTFVVGNLTQVTCVARSRTAVNNSKNNITISIFQPKTLNSGECA